MPKTHVQANEKDHEHLRQVLQEYHPKLAAEKPRIALVFVTADPDSDKPAITLAGARVAAKTSLVSLRDRALMPYDIRIEVDHDLVDRLSTEQATALIDHELEHVVIVRDNKGEIVLRPDGRAKLSLKPDDWLLTGFNSIIERHGENALELRGLSYLVKPLWDKQGQALFPWMTAPQKAKATKSRKTKAA